MEPNINFVKLPGATLTYMLTSRVVVIAILIVASLFLKPEVNGANVDPVLLTGGVVILGVITIVHAILYFNLFSYGVSASAITVNSGILFRESKTIDFTKMQNVNAVRGPLLMIFGLTELQIWTASPSQVTYAVTTGPNGQKNTMPKPKPEAILVLTQAEAENVRSALTKQNTSALISVKTV